MIKLKPTYKTMIWGGTKIRDVLHKDTGNLKRIAESWELSTHKNGMSRIAEGEHEGKTLNEYLDLIGWEQYGERAKATRQLPIMVKYIDAKQNLSIQVHPGDEYAQKHSSESGKNEMWFILDSDPDAFIYLGFSRDVTREEVESSVKAGTIEELLNKIHVKKGDVYYIPAGTVHAIGAGCLLCEVQQTSDATYRLYDYNRLDDNGKKRELHLEDALNVLNYKKTTSFSRRAGTVFHRAKNMLGEIEEIFFTEYHAEGECLYYFPTSRLSIAMVIEGRGVISGEDEADTYQGDTWIFTEQRVKISGKCRVILVSF